MKRDLNIQYFVQDLAGTVAAAAVATTAARTADRTAGAAAAAAAAAPTGGTRKRPTRRKPANTERDIDTTTIIWIRYIFDSRLMLTEISLSIGHDLIGSDLPLQKKMHNSKYLSCKFCIEKVIICAPYFLTNHWKVFIRKEVSFFQFHISFTFDLESKKYLNSTPPSTLLASISPALDLRTIV